MKGSHSSVRTSLLPLPITLLLTVLIVIVTASCLIGPTHAGRDRYARNNNNNNGNGMGNGNGARRRNHQEQKYRNQRQRNNNTTDFVSLPGVVIGGGGGGALVNYENHVSYGNTGHFPSLTAITNTGTNAPTPFYENHHTEFVKGKICIGTRSRLSVPSNREHHYRNLRDRYNNCTYVDGNLELTWLQDDNLDLSFLDNIREVTGYILVSHVDVRRVVFPRLQIIRGRTLFSVQEQHYALFVTYSKMFTLEMPALRDVLQGSVYFFNNFNLCHARSIVWREIISGINGTDDYIYNFTTPERECPKCHDSCNGHCWGEGPHNCQKFSKIYCSPQCAQGRCFGEQPRECCHLFCAGGCTGPTQKDCIACKNFYDDGVCKEECPPMQKYNPTNYLWESNPEGKYAYGATCVKECPEHLLKDNGACVRSCPADKMARDGECVPCNGPCPKTCKGDTILNSGNIDSYKDCTVIEGYIRVLDQTFSGYQDYRNYSLGERYIAMHPDRLEVFSTVKEITGYLDIEGAHRDFKNLSYFRNLEIIHGRTLMENYFASLSIVKSSLESLELRSLKRINSGTVVIQQNEKICFVSDIDWQKVQKSLDHGVVIAKNRNESECKRDGLVCSSQCNKGGCWGSGSDQCLECKNFGFNGTCIADCRNITNAYQFDSKTCKECHPECRTCSGPGTEHCDECVHVRDENRCVTVCPDDKYSDYGICRPCHETCEGCTGPRNIIGPGGCKTCSLAIISSNASVERCLMKNDKCPDGYYWEYVNPQEQGRLKALASKAICRKCHPRCELCSGYGFHEQVCSKCAGYKRGEQCEDECSPDHYADEEKRECFECHPECKGCYGPSAEECIACRSFKVFGDGNPYDNSTLFNCTSKCPAEYSFVNYQSPHIGTFCTSRPPRGSKLTAGMDAYVILTILVTLLVLVVVISLVVGYICRQKAKAKKEAVKMTMVLSGCEDSEPLRPSNIGANLSKLRIVKEAELRKGGVLGMGAFGRVFKGVWVPEGENVKIPVAIKELLKASGAESSEEFLREAYIMASVEHPNLLKLLAVCMTSQMMLITQLMPLGCLLDYVRNNRDKIGSKALLNWSTQIAKGMSYLEEKRLVHRDLAARNVLVQTPSCVKITDFGLAKLLSTDSNEYKAAGGKMPIKWLALECIRHRVFTSKSDVWAFGVTIWELLTFGQRPHENIPAKDIPDLIEVGLKLEQPEICSLDIYCTLLSCWHLDAEMRPSFKQLVNVFAEFARDPGRYLAIPGDKLTRLPAYTSQDEKDLIRKLAPTFEGPETVVEAEDYLQPKAAPGTHGPHEATDEIPKLNRYCKDPMNKNSNGGGGGGDDETDSNAREVGVGNLRLDLPVDEDDYLMPTCQTGSETNLSNGNNNNNNNIINNPLSNNNNNNNTNNASITTATNAGYMDLIGVPASVDNPEYLLNPQSLSARDAPIPTQTLGIPVMAPCNGAPTILEVINVVGSEPTSSDHEYYNDTQRELQPLHRSETRV